MTHLFIRVGCKQSILDKDTNVFLDARDLLLVDPIVADLVNEFVVGENDKLPLAQMKGKDEPVDIIKTPK